MLPSTILDNGSLHASCGSELGFPTQELMTLGMATGITMLKQLVTNFTQKVPLNITTFTRPRDNGITSGPLFGSRSVTSVVFSFSAFLWTTGLLFLQDKVGMEFSMLFGITCHSETGLFPYSISLLKVDGE